MEKIKLGIFDIDGTIRIKEKIPKEIIKGFNSLWESGVITTVATGRGYVRIREILGNFFPKIVSQSAPIGVENGGRISNTNRDTNIFYFPLTEEEIRSSLLLMTENNLLRLYETRRNPGGNDQLVTDGTIVRVTPIQERNISEGNFHTIEAIDVYHKPTTPFEQLAATLVLDSPAFTNTTHVLLDNNESVTVERQRKPLERESIEIAKEQLKEALGL